MNFIDRLNDEELLEQNKRYMQELDHLFCPETIEAREPFRLNVLLGRSSVDLYREPENWVESCLEDLARQYEKMREQSLYRPLILMGKPYSVHFTDQIFGAEVIFNETSGEWYNKTINSRVGELKVADLVMNETWVLAKRIAKAFKESGVKAPYFSMPTISGPLNILINLYGSGVLMDMLLEPEAVSHDLEVITQAQEAMHSWYSQQIEEGQLQCTTAVIRLQPPGYSQLCGCSTQLISPELYDKLIRPYDERILKAHGKGGMIHLCGSHLQHLETFKGMKCLRALQLNDQAADDLEKYAEVLRNDQVLYVRPTGKMSPERIKELCLVRPSVIVSNIAW
ncbi:MAG: hypothetical protein KH366_19810 [Clostridiaceae bacterium]|nr:hypothetical protein [Clostridiaceae bacterium]